jgi:type II secretory pathway component GspD/PulD (secretin)
MTLRTVISFLLVVVLVASCAPKKALVKDTPSEPPSAFQLPPIEEEATGEKAKKEDKKAPLLEAVLIEEDAEEKFIILNFENTDIRTIIATFSELLEINYILTPGVSGSVTIQSYKKFPMKDLFRIFQSLLQINGLTAVKEGAFYKIVPIDTAKQQSLDVRKATESIYELDPAFITQIVPLSYVKAGDVANILRNLMPRGTDIIIYEPTNMLIVTALPPTLVKFMKLVEALDIPESETDTLKTFVYYVENGEAKQLAAILKAIYGGKSTSVRRTVPTRVNTRTPPIPGAQALPGEIGELTVTAYDEINALILKCSPRTYLSLLQVMKKIDIPPKQVLIEVIIAEVSLGEGFEFGMEWLLKSTRGDVVGLNLGGVEIPPGESPFPEGFGAVFSGTSRNDRYNAVLGALASNSKINVLASPHILARDNKEATIEIGDEVPIATGMTQQPATGGGTTLVSSGQIQYKTVGTILRVTPRITEKDMVTMQITQEKSLLGKPIEVASQKFQGFSKRKASTTATVQSGHTLILGGLISETKDTARSGVPFLSKIPILGWLFSSTSKSSEKTELILLVTPHVISNQDDADVLTKEFQNRVRTISDRIKDMEKEKIAEVEEEKEVKEEATSDE